MNSGAKIALLLLGFMQAGFAIPNKPECDDFLRARRVAIPGMRFESCTAGKTAQLRSPVARYAIPGHRARSAEVLFMRDFQMAPLVFRCCGWEVEGGRPGTYKDARGFSHTVSLTSGETTEKNWEKIPEFIVTDELFLEDP